MNRRRFFGNITALFGAAALSPLIPSIGVVKTRPFVATWGLEEVAALKNAYSIDVESLLIAELAKAIQEEIDREILNYLHALAQAA